MLVSSLRRCRDAATYDLIPLYPPESLRSIDWTSPVSLQTSGSHSRAQMLTLHLMPFSNAGHTISAGM